MQNHRTTGLTQEQFTTLPTALTHHITWGKPGGRPPAVTLPQALKATLLYHRHNLTEELLAELFNTLEQALKKTLSPMTTSLEESLKTPGSLVIDGTLIPTWN